MPDAPLIATKFHLAPSRPDLIPRPQLFELLDGGLHYPLVLISAPPGFGKSMLMAGWLQSRSTADLRTAWLSLDEGDNEPAVFWRYFIATLQRVSPSTGETALKVLAGPTVPGMQTVLATLLNELANVNDPLMLVLDDYHQVQNPEIHETLKFFLDHQPENFHLAILTREDPPLGLARRRARRQMVEVRAQDLRFNTEEATEFLNGICHLTLNASQVDTLEQRTEGWIAGLQMAALSLQGRDPITFFQSFTGDDRYVAEYLIEEVLQFQPEGVRGFLLKTSILDKLCAPLCAAVTGMESARETLDYLERANMFLISLDTHREWYRYHHLFSELLRQRLRETMAAQDIASLHRAASVWYEVQSDISAAVRHARQIPDEAKVLHLLETYAGIYFQNGELPQLFELARALPPTEREKAPNLCAAVAWATLAASHYDMVEDWLQAIESHFGLSADAALEDPTLDSARRAALLEVLVVRLQLSTFPQDSGRALAIRDQLNLLPPDQHCLFNDIASLKPVLAFNLGLIAENSADSGLAARTLSEAISLSRESQNWHLYLISSGHLGNVQTAMGKLQAARVTFEQALDQSANAGTIPYLGLLHSGLGWLYYEWNDLASAERHFYEAMELARVWNHWEVLIPGTLGQAHLKQRSGDTQAALEILRGLDSPPIENMALPLEACAAFYEAEYGNRDLAAAWLAAHSGDPTLMPDPTNESYLLEVARTMTAIQRYDEAQALIQKLIAYAGERGRAHLLVRARVARTGVLALQGKKVEAFAGLLTCLPSAATEGYVSTFVEQGEVLHKLLLEVREQAPAGLKAYVEKILQGFQPVDHPPTRRGLELSQREQEILSLVAAGLSNQEIAGRLVISITTVKTHVGNIFNKLGVTSRTQALSRAVELGLLPRS